MFFSSAVVVLPPCRNDPPLISSRLSEAQVIYSTFCLGSSCAPPPPPPAIHNGHDLGQLLLYAGRTVWAPLRSRKHVTSAWRRSFPRATSNEHGVVCRLGNNSFLGSMIKSMGMIPGGRRYHTTEYPFGFLSRNTWTHAENVTQLSM